MKDFIEPAHFSLELPAAIAPLEDGREKALGLARMLAFALIEAREIEAHECEAMLHYGLGDLQARFGFTQDELAPRFTH